MSRAATHQAQFAAEHAGRWQDTDAARSYASRPAVPGRDVRRSSTRLIADEPRHVLDVGCGTGKLARRLARASRAWTRSIWRRRWSSRARVWRAETRANLRWSVGRAEEAPLDPPYALDRRRREPALDGLRSRAAALRARAHDRTACSRSCIVDDSARGAVARRADGDHQAPLDGRGLRALRHAHRAGTRRVSSASSASAPRRRSSSRRASRRSSTRTTRAARSTRAHIDAERFDREVRELLAPHCPDGVVRRPIRGRVDWGKPLVG